MREGRRAIGLIDNLILDQTDPNTGEYLGCYKVMNDEEYESENPEAEEILFALKSQGINHEVIVNFIDFVEAEKMQLPERRTDSNYDIEDMDFYTNEILPYIQTDRFLEEVSNLKIKTLGSGKFGIEQQTRSVDKDRYSAISYGLWYIKNFEDEFEEANSGKDMSDFLLIN